MPLREVQKQKILHSKPVILYSEKWLWRLKYDDGFGLNAFRKKPVYTDSVCRLFLLRRTAYEMESFFYAGACHRRRIRFFDFVGNGLADAADLAPVGAVAVFYRCPVHCHKRRVHHWPFLDSV